MINFSQSLHLITTFLERLPHGHGVRVNGNIPEVGLQVVETHALGTNPQHQGVSGRTTHRLIDIRLFKQHPAGGQLVDVWCLRDLVPVTAQHRLQIIHRDKKNIRLVRG